MDNPQTFEDQLFTPLPDKVGLRKYPSIVHAIQRFSAYKDWRAHHRALMLLPGYSACYQRYRNKLTNERLIFGQRGNQARNITETAYRLACREMHIFVHPGKRGCVLCGRVLLAGGACLANNQAVYRDPDIGYVHPWCKARLDRRMARALADEQELFSRRRIARSTGALMPDDDGYASLSAFMLALYQAWPDGATITQLTACDVPIPDWPDILAGVCDLPPDMRINGWLLGYALRAWRGVYVSGLTLDARRHKRRHVTIWQALPYRSMPASI